MVSLVGIVLEILGIWIVENLEEMVIVSRLVLEDLRKFVFLECYYLVDCKDEYFCFYECFLVSSVK